MLVFPHAKINIGLQIVKKRTDGYHELNSIFYPVKLYDMLEMIPAQTMEFASSGIEIPGDKNANLILKAYDLIRKDFDISPATIHLYKNIPIGAGLGGGSSDASFTLRMMNNLFHLGLSDAEMMDYVRTLGSDCAFFIQDKPQFAVGKGDEFEDIALDLSAYQLVLVHPPVFISTAEAYKDVQPVASRFDLRTLASYPMKDWKDLVFNDFETGMMKKYPELNAVKSALYECGANYAAMSGSGSTFYGIFAEKPEGLEHHFPGSKISFC